MTLSELHEALSQVCPIHGVSSDKVISFKDEATPAERAEAQALADATDLEPGLSSVPFSVTRFQACAALLGAGMLDQVQSMMADPSTPTLAKLAWDTAQEFRRHSPIVTQLGALLGLDEHGLDFLFITAGGIEA